MKKSRKLNKLYKIVLTGVKNRGGRYICSVIHSLTMTEIISEEEGALLLTHLHKHRPIGEEYNALGGNAWWVYGDPNRILFLKDIIKLTSSQGI